MARLGELFRISSGGTPSKNESTYYDNGFIPWIKTGDLKNKYVCDNVECITEAGLKNSAAKLFPPNTVLIAMYGATIGACSILPFEAATNQACAAFLPNDNILPEYLYYFLSSKKERFVQDGVGGAQPNISAGYLKNVKIEVVHKEQQKVVIKALGEMDNLICLRKQQLEKLDEIVKSRFVEMFGDPELNPFGWECLSLSSLVSVEPQNGLYKPQSDYVEDGSGIPILRIDAFYNGKVTDFQSLRRLICSDAERERYLLHENDIVINRVNSIEYLGKCAHITGMLEDTVFESNMMRFHLNESIIDAGFAVHLLCTQYIYKQILNRAKKAVNQASINQGDVMSFQMLVPPLGLQKQFVSFVEQTDKSKVEIQKSLEQLEMLKKALMQKYFG